jgi:hypothetical protein
MTHLLAILWAKILHYLIWQNSPPMNPNGTNAIELKNKTTAKVVL